jgi:hypothetical protein
MPQPLQGEQQQQQPLEPIRLAVARRTNRARFSPAMIQYSPGESGKSLYH